jgi:DNA topoisomerase IB
VDARGREQYRYHDLWPERRDREKFDAMVDFARMHGNARYVNPRTSQARAFSNHRFADGFEL